MNKKILTSALVIVGLTFGLVLAVFGVRTVVQLVNKAATPTGTTSMTLTPGTSNISANTASNVTINANIGSLSVDGFQVVATVSGTIPSDLQFIPSTPSGMQLVLNTMTGATEKTLSLAYITQNTAVPYNAGSANLGSFTFTAPATGSMTISFNEALTKIVQNQTSQDVLAIPVPATYTFVTGATASPQGTSSPSSSPGATASPTATPNSANCVRGNQSITLSPNSQSAQRGKSLSYTVTVTNNDDKNCSKADFNLSAILPYANWTATFSQTVLSIAPQTSGTAIVSFTSSTTSPFGDLPVGVNVSGPKSSVVAAATYKVLTPLATQKPITKATPEVIVVPGGIAKSSATPSAIPTFEPYVAPSPEIGDGASIISNLSNLPTWLIAGIAGFLLILLFFILRALFGKKDQNPPKITPPSNVQVPPPPMPAPMSSPSAPQQPTQISHSVEAPINQ